MADLENVCIRLTESMSGRLKVGEVDPERGEELGLSEIRFDVEIRIPDLDRFLRDPRHTAELSGSVTVEPLGGPHPIRDGVFNLFAIDQQSGVREMTYGFRFTGDDGRTYTLSGRKKIYDDPGDVDVVEDMTRLFTRVYEGSYENIPPYAAGVLYFKLRNLPKLVSSIEVENVDSLRQKLAAIRAFTGFALGALRDEYLDEIDPIYRADYNNLALTGVLESGREKAPFFFASGWHGIGFPWGDNSTFSDVLLAINDGNGGYLRYAMTDHALEELELDLKEGKYRYQGPVFRITEGYSASFHQMRRRAPELEECEAKLEVDLALTKCTPAQFPFPILNELARGMAAKVRKKLAKWMAEADSPGIKITPYTVTVRSGSLRVGDREWTVSTKKTGGEAEHGEFRNIKEPTLLYHYLCAPEPSGRSARVQIKSGTLRDEKTHWTKDRMDKLAGRLISRTSSVEFFSRKGKTRIQKLASAREKAKKRATPFRKLDPPVIEVNNDHMATAVFQRRIVPVVHPESGTCLALEEDMSPLRTGPIDSERQVRVASIKDDDKYVALDRVLEETCFNELLDAHRERAGKSPADLLIAIKPNFMFAYNKRDRSTFTDPELVGHLVRRLRGLGYEKIRVVEAQSTYGEYFTKRGVADMAEYLGYDGSDGYEIVDMTADAVEIRDFPPPLGRHPVSAVWRDADFRISFAKNKTHSYTYYTLTLKNIYGALPLANKFKEYHCDRDIYGPTIQYLEAFPVHYGLVDGYLSADGPFGIFADTDPNETHTLIGGEDLVAVDWVGATKMGLDPMVSKHMQLAVKKFGKPEIDLIGDASPYLPWLNVPVALSVLTHGGMDANHRFGNLLYAISAHMDRKHFKHKSKAPHIMLLRLLTRPIRETFFVQTDRPPTLASRVMSRLFHRLGY